MKLVGKGVYKIVSKPSFDFSINNIRKANVEMPTDYYYDILHINRICNTTIKSNTTRYIIDTRKLFFT